MFVADTLAFHEFAMREPLPLATLQNAVIEFLRGREDAVVFGAQAVNAYVHEPRMTQDVDLLSSRATEFARELRDHLSERFRIAVRVREIAEGRGYRLYQIRKAGNRHLVDVRSAEKLPETRRIAQVLVVAPADLIASKVIAYHQRRGHPKSGTDWRDLALLLLTFPELKRDPGPVTERLQASGASPTVQEVWRKLVETEILAEEEDEEFE